MFPGRRELGGSSMSLNREQRRPSTGDQADPWRALPAVRRRRRGPRIRSGPGNRVGPRRGDDSSVRHRPVCPGRNDLVSEDRLPSHSLFRDPPPVLPSRRTASGWCIRGGRRRQGGGPLAKMLPGRLVNHGTPVGAGYHSFVVMAPEGGADQVGPRLLVGHRRVGHYQVVMCEVDGQPAIPCADAPALISPRSTARRGSNSIISLAPQV